METQPEENLVKRYSPIHMFGTSICSDCLIESAKNMIGLENPEILQIETHSKTEEYDLEERDNIALKCLKQIMEKNKINLSVLLPSDMMFNYSHGSIFFGRNVSEIEKNQTIENFAEKISSEIKSLNLFKEAKEKIMEDVDDEHEVVDEINIIGLQDIMIFYDKRKHAEDVDDEDIGMENGFNFGMENGFLLAKVALYKMHKKKILPKNFDEMIEILDGMKMNLHVNSEEFKIWVEKFKKYLDKKKKIEDNEND